jgi:hypothetical protein
MGIRPVVDGHAARNGIVSSPKPVEAAQHLCGERSAITVEHRVGAEREKSASWCGLPADPPHFVGRGSEIAHIRALFHEATLGTGSGLLLAGERGIGKTRLLGECATLEPDAVVLSARCTAVAAPGLELTSQLAQSIGVPSRRGSSAPPSELLYSSLIERSKRKTVVVLIDDLHLAKANELAAFEALLQLTRAHRLAVVACFTDATPNTPVQTGLPIDNWLRERTQLNHLARSMKQRSSSSLAALPSLRHAR